VDDQADRGADVREQPLQRREVAYVDIVVTEAGLPRQLAHPPAGRGFIAEEVAPEIVVDPDDVEALVEEEVRRFGADQSAGSGYQDHAHTNAPAS
jgi:hypothetical protein